MKNSQFVTERISGEKSFIEKHGKYPRVFQNKVTDSRIMSKTLLFKFVNKL